VIQPDRGQAQQWAREELSRPEYARARPGWFRRLVGWLLDHLERVAAGTGLGAGQLVALLLVLAMGVAVVVVLNVRRQVAAAARTGVPLGATTLSAEEHRLAATRAQSEGRYDDAVREWLRALARRLDERGLLDPRPGRTADELAAEVARLLPALAPDLHTGARLFDDVSYGSHHARAEDAERIRRLDAAVEAARPGLPGAVIGVR
jgi:uncharacterized protein DUF4129